jgi:hypothetical protein
VPQFEYLELVMYFCWKFTRLKSFYPSHDMPLSFGTEIFQLYLYQSIGELPFEDDRWISEASCDFSFDPPSSALCSQGDNLI